VPSYYFIEPSKFANKPIFFNCCKPDNLCLSETNPVFFCLSSPLLFLKLNRQILHLYNLISEKLPFYSNNRDLSFLVTAANEFAIY
tara:strand:+ start:751 stop:1008 length:258 start_codon:yes stop_codon:yes gene_type:complete